MFYKNSAMRKKIAIFCTAGVLLAVTACEKEKESTELITFEELDPGTEGYWNGSGGEGGFTSGNAFFPNTFTDWGGGITSWSGFAFSNHTDAGTPGFANQYSCYAGSGAGSSQVFALVYLGDTLVFDIPQTVDKISVANSTYSALSMRDGDDFAKKFGGEDGTDPDFFHLIITGIDAEGKVTGTMTVALADFSSENTEEDYISNGWTEISLDFLGHVKKLAFGFDSSDKGDWGINTPQYACIDNITGVLQD
jgi:hypothetical protein